MAKYDKKPHKNTHHRFHKKLKIKRGLQITTIKNNFYAI